MHQVLTKLGNLHSKDNSIMLIQAAKSLNNISVNMLFIMKESLIDIQVRSMVIGVSIQDPKMVDLE